MMLDERRAMLARSLAEHDMKSMAMHDIGLLGCLLSRATIVDLGGLVAPEMAPDLFRYPALPR